jgi:hypothetical protein
MKAIRFILSLLAWCLFFHTEDSKAQPDDKISQWLDTSAPIPNRLAAYNHLVAHGDIFPQLLARQQANSKAVTESLVLAFSQDDMLARIRALDWTLRLKDAGAYAKLAQAALHAKEPEVRALGFGLAEFFGDKSELLTSAAVAEIQSGRSGPALTSASRLASQLEIPDAIWPLALLVTNSNPGLAVMAAERLAQFPQLPDTVTTFLKQAAAVAQGKLTAQESRLVAPIIPGDPTTSPSYQTRRLVSALRMTLDKPSVPTPDEPKSIQPSKRATESAKSATVPTGADIQSAPGGSATSRGEAQATDGPSSRFMVLACSIGLAAILILWIRTRSR